MTTRNLILAAALVAGISGTAQADCSILGIKYATGTETRDRAGTKIYCNPEGRWQSVPVFQYPEIAAGYRFRPIPPLPRDGFELRQRQSAALYHHMQREYDFWLGDW